MNMSNKKSEISKKSKEADHAAKKAAVLKNEKKNRLPLILTITGCVILVVLAGVYFLRGSAATPSTVAAADIVSYPMATFEDGKARHYQLKTDDGAAIKFFVVKSSDGVIRAAFDACDVCWKAGLGYYQDGDFMICRNCGRRFASVKVNEIRGGCNPAPLNREVVNGTLVLKVNDILEGRQFFDFSNRG